ncbi:hypothetical protein KBB96_09535 [Luteolibacter ambystomatis]|uniref:Uncharacterized protein n=1 Tax=Luteolibacter ambystomatis TaxID=2824561 RepID=A0A975J376_9BACT|nr:hypothetical protein [Luteolibacter ambystomatis]QUE53121.1 hypothetical protein KBB96_09535 [Luteolibacter ambystomatis]
MQTPDPIEAALARLMPTAMSVSGQRSIEDMLDALAADLPAAKVVPWYRRPVIGLSAAAAIAGILAIPAFLHTGGPARTTAPHFAAAPDADAGFQLLSEADRIESMSDEGWIANPDGSIRQAVRVHTIGENTFKDRETGYTVRVSEPRDETLLMPVSSF